MPSVTLAALLDTRPASDGFWGRAWLESVFEEHGLGQTLSGWSVGAVVGTDTLVKSRPLTRDGSEAVGMLDDLSRVPAPIAVAAIGTDDSTQPVRLARWRRFLMARGERGLGDGLRSALRAELPDFLARAPNHRSNVDIVFLRFMAYLHELGGLGSKSPEPPVLRAALCKLGERLDEGPLNLLVSDGRTLAIHHRGGTLLAFEPPDDARPNLPYSVDKAKAATPAKLFLWHAGPPADAPRSGAERIAEGVLSVAAARPSILTRE